MEIAADLVISVLIVLGGAFALIGSWGLARLPSLMTRLHGPTKATTVGVGSCLLAAMVYFPTHGGGWSAHELLIALFLFITAPISANMIAKAHLHRQRCRLDQPGVDGINGGLPEPGGEVGWATFWKGAPGAQAAPEDRPVGRLPDRD
jgi:multicomponent K+:H+ antiporter subunit G